MKKLLKILAVGIFTLTPLVAVSSVSALSTCSVGYTGPDSNNQCTSVTKYSCTVKNTNTVEITNENDQVVASGAVSNSGNTQGGSSTSGTVSNTNGSSFTVTIVNQNPEAESLGTCTAAVIIPANVVPENPVQPTQTTASGVAVLPKTSGDAVNILVIIASSVAALAIVGIGGIALYRYYKSL